MVIELRKTHWTDIRDNTGKVNQFGHYVPAGLHRCQWCFTYDDPRRISIELPNDKGLHVCVTCGKDHLLPFLLHFFTMDQLMGTEEDGILTKYPKDPYKDADKKIPLSERPFEKIKASIEGQENEATQTETGQADNQTGEADDPTGG